MNIEVDRKDATSPPYACTVHKTESECNSKADCEWSGKRGCVRRKNVLKGWRYKFTDSTNVLQESNPVDDLAKDFSLMSFNYNPDWDPEVPKIPRKMVGKAGTYGMAFFPALPCGNDYQPSKYIGKIFWYANESSAEFRKASEIEREIAQGTSQKYFTFTTMRCGVKFPTGIQELDDWVKKKRKDNGYSKIPRSGLVDQHLMEYSGMTYFEYLDTYYNSDTITIYELLKIVENYFYGLKRMNDCKYSHSDFKGNNVVVSNTKRARIIDFGLSVKHSEFYNESRVMDTMYWYISAPEFLLYQLQDPNYTYDKFVGDTRIFNQDESNLYKYIIQSKYSETDDIMVHQYINSNGKLVIVEDEVRQDFLNMMQSMHDNDQHVPINYMKTHNSHKKQDVYSLGLMILRVLANLGKRSTSLEPGGRIGPLATNFYRLMRGMLYPTPEKRFTINQSIVFLRKIINEAEKSSDTTKYGQNPFEVNQDPQYMKDIFKQKFGSVINNNKLAKLLRYINTLL